MADFGFTGFVLLVLLLFTGLKRLWRMYLLESGFIKAFSFGLFWGTLGIMTGDFLDTLLDGPRVAMELFWMMGILFGVKGRKDEN
jgi:hypothetical protein